MVEQHTVLAVIPARYGSTRFPGKPLVPLAGRPLLVHVLDRVSAARTVDAILVATDDPRIAEVVTAAGHEAAMTRPDHLSGSDRIAEAIAGRSADLIVNVQGDEPLLDPSAVDTLVQGLALADCGAATLAVPFDDPRELADPHVVKVVCDTDGKALYFSRAPIPGSHPGAGPAGSGLRHLGIYAWRRADFEAFSRLKPSPLELREGLEQLRYLENGGRMRVIEVESAAPGVDTPEDLARCEALLARRGGPV